MGEIQMCQCTGVFEYIHQQLCKIVVSLLLRNKPLSLLVLFVFFVFYRRIKKRHGRVKRQTYVVDRK